MDLLERQPLAIELAAELDENPRSGIPRSEIPRGGDNWPQNRGRLTGGLVPQSGPRSEGEELQVIDLQDVIIFFTCWHCHCRSKGTFAMKVKVYWMVKCRDHHRTGSNGMTRMECYEWTTLSRAARTKRMRWGATNLKKMDGMYCT